MIDTYELQKIASGSDPELRDKIFLLHLKKSQFKSLGILAKPEDREIVKEILDKQTEVIVEYLKLIRE